MNSMAQAQQSLFNMLPDAPCMRKILAMPKVDLHRHLTGSIDPDMAIRVAVKHGVELPAYVVADLQKELYPSARIEGLKDYFDPWWKILNRLFVSRDSTHDIVLEVIRKAAQDNLAYLELRMGPYGFLGNGPLRFEDFLDGVAAAVREANLSHDMVTRCILGIPRHVFAQQPNRDGMLALIVSMLSPLFPDCFVGVDLNGVENGTGDLQGFDSFFRMAAKRGFGVTVHAGECGPAANVRYAVEHLGAKRIGHGLAALADESLLRELSAQGCALEICPTSNMIVNLISRPTDLHLERLKDLEVPFAICTDNPARNEASLSEELFKLVKPFSLSLADIKGIIYSSLEHCFADGHTKGIVKLKLDGFAWGE